jgi:hypothetical protein
MQLSNSNELLKFSVVNNIEDNYGGIKKEESHEFTIFGKLCLIQIDHKNNCTYEVKMRSNNQLDKVKGKTLLISAGNRKYLVKDIVINKKLTTIKCHDYETPGDNI